MDLIVIADDYGYSPERDMVIIDSFKNGIVRGSSLLVNGYSAEMSVPKAKECGLELGLHLNFSEGIPVSPINQVSSLVIQNDRGQHVFRGKQGFRNAVDDGIVSLDDIQTETIAQVERFKLFYGSYPVYFDGHQHIHIIPQLVPLLAKILSSYHVHYTRLPLDNDEESGWITDETQKEAHVKHFYNSLKVRQIYKEYNFLCPIGLGMSIGGKNMSIQRINNILLKFPREKSQYNVFEMMTHPGIPYKDRTKGGCGEGSDDFSQSEDRVHEHNILTSTYLRDILTEKGVRFCSYSESKLNTMKSPTDFTTSKRRILMLSSLKEGTGNTITCYRIYNYFFSLNYSVHIFDTTDNCTQEAFQAVLSRWNPNLIVAIHAYRSGKYVVKQSIPYVLVLGGTDINVAVQDPSKKDIIAKVFTNARHVIAFTDSMYERAQSFIKEMKISTSVPISIIPQGCVFSSFSSSSSLRESLHLSSTDKLILLPAGIRPVKNILYLFKCIYEWYKRDPSIYLCFLGPILDRDYAKIVFSYIPNENIHIELCTCSNELFIEKQKELYTNIHFHCPLSHDLFLKCLKDADLCINSSDSEGQAAIIEEAWLCETVMVARDNEGNRHTITPNYNGFLFNSCEEFIQQSETILNDAREYNTICMNAIKTLNDIYNPEIEKQKYNDIIKQYL
ncbi:hypothetical protein WA158_004697 [Blastocystis sp. Blastoise]